jgi:hypothetical protein
MALKLKAGWHERPETNSEFGNIQRDGIAKEYPPVVFFGDIVVVNVSIDVQTIEEAHAVFVSHGVESPWEEA